MSNVYILEPPTSGKVLLKTSVGDIEIELWSKEAPKACRNFIQLCMEGYYDGTIFHRVVKDFIVQGGDPQGDGTGGESIYGEPFKDEFHQRLKFVRRGLVAMANAGKDDNGSQFFITLAATPELQNLHTIFGKIGGDTIYNVLKFQDGLIKNERPEFPHKIIKTEVLNNPFPDIVPRVKEEKTERKAKREKKAGVKDFKLLSFGAEAEEDEEESTKVSVKLSGKGKSTHDILDDPKLSSKTLIEQQKEVIADDEEEIDPELQLENIRNKLKSEKKEIKKILASHKHTYDEDSDDERKAAKQRKLDEVRKEIEDVKKDYHKNKLKRNTEAEEEKKEETARSSTIQEYQNEYDKYKDKKKEQEGEYDKFVSKKTQDKYKEKKKELPNKGGGREDYTLDLLAKFKNKLQAAKEKASEVVKNEEELEDVDDVDNDESWMSHELRFKDDAPILAKDANRKDDDWYEIYDPRNPISKRRRGEMMNKETKK